MKISVESTHVDEKQWNKNGRSGTIRTQEATAENKYFRRRCRLDLGTSDPYPVGEYEMDLESNVDVGDFGDFKIVRKPKLVRIEAKAPLAKAS